MLTEDANQHLRLLHTEVGADPELIDAGARRLLLEYGELSEIDRKILAPQTRSSFFEIWSPFWLLAPEVPVETKRDLGAAMLVSWTGIAQLDRDVDEISSACINDRLRRRACIWSDAVRARLQRTSEWTKIIDRWIKKNHGMDPSLSPEEVILQKNPFYPEIFKVYLSDSDYSCRIGRNYTLVVGILDEVADVIDDAACGRPNFILSTLDYDASMSGDLRSFTDRILSLGVIGQALAEALDILTRLENDAEVLGLFMFIEVLKGLRLSFHNYEEFCTARAITYELRKHDVIQLPQARPVHGLRRLTSLKTSSQAK